MLLFFKSTNLYASCCSSASLFFGVGRLASYERALVELGSSARYVFGSWNSDSSFKAGHLSHLPHLTFEEEVQAMVRIFDFFEPFVRLPVKIQKSDVRTGANLSDISFGARIPILRENSIKYMPSVTFIQATRMPTGASYKMGASVDPESITSTGQWLLSFAVLMEKELKGLIFGLGYSISLEPRYFDNKAIRPGPLQAPLFAVSMPIFDRDYLSFTLSTLFHSPTKKQKTSIINTDRRKVSLAAAYVFTLHSHIKLNAQIGSDIPISYVGKSFNSEFFMRIGMRFGVF